MNGTVRAVVLILAVACIVVGFLAAILDVKVWVGTLEWFVASAALSLLPLKG